MAGPGGKSKATKNIPSAKSTGRYSPEGGNIHNLVPVKKQSEPKFEESEESDQSHQNPRMMGAHPLTQDPHEESIEDILASKKRK